MKQSSLFLLCTGSLLPNQRNRCGISRLVSSLAAMPVSPSADGRRRSEEHSTEGDHNSLTNDAESLSWLSGNSAKGPYRLAYRHVVPKATPESGSSTTKGDREKEYESNHHTIAAVTSSTNDGFRSAHNDNDNDNDNDNNNDNNDNNDTLPETQQRRVAILFCNGFRSVLSGGTKVLALEAHCRKRKWEFCAFDYRGHGLSSGNFVDFVLSDWIDDARTVLDRVVLPDRTHHGKRVILVGSSMGAWISVHLALRYNSINNNNNNNNNNIDNNKDPSSADRSRSNPPMEESDQPGRSNEQEQQQQEEDEQEPASPAIGGILGIASAPDFLREFERVSTPEQRASWREDGVAWFANPYEPDPVPITRALLDDALAQWELLSPPPLPLTSSLTLSLPRTRTWSERDAALAPNTAVRCPVRLLHGKRDEDVPWTKSAELANHLLRNQAQEHGHKDDKWETNQKDGGGGGDGGGDVGLVLIEDGDHRLSRPQDIRLLLDALDEIVDSSFSVTKGDETRNGKDLSIEEPKS